MERHADRNLLFGLLALQNGIIEQSALVAAFHAWTRDKSRSLADILLDRGDIDQDDRANLSALAAKHIQRHGGDTERSLAAVSAPASLREGLARLASPEIEETLVGPATSKGESPADAEATVSHGSQAGNGRRFRILRPHARGGLGEVFVALDDELHREVALKQILDHHADDPTSRTRFVLEAEITGGLEHPGIVPVYGLGSYDDGRPYYAMRFVRGDSLKEAIAGFHGDEVLRKDPGKRSLALRKLLRRFVDVCNAVDYAHGRGVLHRDIKPANVIVGKHGETLVVDWGLAKAMGKSVPGPATEERTLMPSSASGSAETLPGSAMGTPAYMSPEQAGGDLDNLGPRSDVYSLGATLYCLLTGKAPFERDDLGAVLRAVAKGDFPGPRKHDPSIDRALEAVCLKAMAMDPGARHASARALADDVERWAADEPVSAWREPLGRRARRWARRNRTAVTTALVGLLATLAGTAAVLVVKARANGALRDANAELAASRDREAARFGLAMDAIGVFHTGVSEDFLLSQAEFGDLRSRLLQGARDFYRKLEAELKQQPDRPARRALGGAYLSLGKLDSNIGRQDDALAELRRSVEIRRELARGAGEDTDSLAELGRSLFALREWAMDNFRDPEPLVSFKELRELWDRICRPGAGGERFRGDLADAIQSANYMNSPFGFDEKEALIRRALAIREELAEEDPADPVRQQACARAYYSLGYLLSNRPRRSPESIACYERAAEIYQAQLGKGSGDGFDRNSLASALNNLSNLYGDAGRLGDQEAALLRMIAIRQSLVQLYPAVGTFHNNLGHGLNALAGFFSIHGRWERALATYTRARDGLERAIPDHHINGKMVTNLRETGRTLDLLGRPEEAEEYYRRSLVLGREMVDREPSLAHLRASLASSINYVGWHQYRSRRPASALASYQESLAIYSKLADEFPSVASYRGEVANVLTNLAEVLRLAGRLDEARLAGDRAIALREALIKADPEAAEEHSALGETLLRLGQVRRSAGDVAGASRAWRRAIKKYEDFPPTNFEQSCLAACAYASLSGLGDLADAGLTPGEAEVAARKAVSILARSVTRGWREVDWMRVEAGLDPIRSRDDFRLLMMDAIFPSDPFCRRR